MKRTKQLFFACLAGGACLLGAAEPQVHAPITRAALFKNGYALIVREIPAAPGDSFLLNETITPVHGTLWAAPGDGLSITGVKRIGSEPNRNPFGNLAASYAGQAVTVTLRASGNQAPRVVSGIVVQLGKQEGEVPLNSPFLAIRANNGVLTTFLQSEITAIESSAINETLPQEKRMLLIQRVGSNGKPFAVSYLTAGLTWAPAYRIALGPDALLQIDQTATLINELEDLNEVEFSLVSGFPNLDYLQVTSPLATGMTIRNFLQQLGKGDFYPAEEAVYADRAQYYMSAPKFMSASAVSPLKSSGQSEDIHFTSAGKFSLAKGEVFYKALNTAQAKYERLVEWEIPDRRDSWGRQQDNNNSTGGELWDAVRFKNPLKSPITTAPIEIVDGEKLLGQTTINWVNPNEETVVRIAQAQTVTGIRTEYEAEKAKKPKEVKEPVERSGYVEFVSMDDFEIVSIAGYNYRKATVNGEIKLHNFRSSEAKITVKLQFSGKLLSAEGGATSKQLEIGIYNINPRNELSWEFSLKPGEELIYKYQYSVLIRI